MNRPDQFEQQLQQQYQHDKARHVLPAQVKNALLKKARQKQARQRHKAGWLRRNDWQGLWRNTQLALCCALLLLLGYLLQPVQPHSPLYYQISYSQGAEYRQVQHHVASNIRPQQSTALAQAQQQYRLSGEQSRAFYAQTGLLQQQQDHWQIKVCDQLLLTIDKQLLSQIDLSADITPQFAQWVEFTSDAAGLLIAIKPAAAPLHCSQG